MGDIGWPEILIILVIVIVVFGSGKLAEAGPALGKAISGFKRAMREGERDADAKAPAVADVPAVEKKE